MNYTELAAATGISIPYANQIVNGERKPSRAMAFLIYDKTGERFGHLSNLTDREIELQRQLDSKAAA